MVVYGIAVLGAPRPRATPFVVVPVFAWVLMVAGVPIVVASLWPVDSAATADLMISFHRHRKEDPDHISTVQALRRAQLEMIHNTQPNSNASFGWAAFVAIGGYAAY